MRKRYFFIVLWCTLSYTLAVAGPKRATMFKKISENAGLKLLVFNQAIGMPPSFVNGRLHPGVELGIQAPFIHKNKNSFLDYSLSLGYFSQQQLQRVVFIKVGSGYRFQLVKGFSLRPSLNLSAFYVSQLNDEFIYQGNGVYEKYKGKKIQAKPGIGVDLLSPTLKFKSVNFNLIGGYEFGLQLPFSLLSSTLPLNQLHVGILVKK